ncbi:MAG TPA: PilZ domain-containing protein [Kofleriaceae bacterium]|nr:PilZ domain-containing protein [Kofleriaceae bacterium]
MGEPSTPERRRHFRGKARAGRRIRLRYRSRGGEWSAAETRNIGVGGAFILGATLAVKSEIEVEIDIAGRETPLRLGGEVRWNADGNGEDPLGVGVQFVDVDIDVLLELNSYLATLTGTDLAEP